MRKLRQLFNKHKPTKPPPKHDDTVPSTSSDGKKKSKATPFENAAPLRNAHDGEPSNAGPAASSKAHNDDIVPVPKSVGEAKDSSFSAAPVVTSEQDSNKRVQGSFEDPSSFTVKNMLPNSVSAGDTATRDAKGDRMPPTTAIVDHDLALFCRKPVMKSISEKLWSQAYNELQETEPDLVACYEKIWEDTYTGSLGIAGDGGPDEEKMRRETVQTVANSAVDKLKVEDKIKGNVDGFSKFMDVVGDLITTAFVAATGAPLGPVTVLLKALKNNVEETNANRDGLKYVLAQMDWYFALCDLDLQTDTGATAHLQDKLKDEVRNLYGMILLFLMKSICSYQKNRLLENSRLALKLDDWEGSLSAIKDAETTVGKRLETYRNCRARNLACRKEIADRLKQLPYIADARYDSSRLEHRHPCQEGTRTTFLAMVRDWAMRRTSKPIFWLCGLAGTGKSTISITVARELSRQGYLGASFFFLRGGGDLAKASSLIPTLAIQLANRIPGAAEYISEAIANHPDIVSSNKGSQWEHLIQEPLSHLSSGSLSPMIIVFVIDALDECDNQEDIRLLLRVFSSTRQLQSIQIRFFLTSRPELPINLNFKSMKEDVHEDVLLHEVHREETQKDIQLYLSRQLELISRKHELPLHWVDEEDLTKLASKCGGLFIYASTVCQFIDELDHDPEERLAIVLDLSGSTSRDDHLDEMYEMVLQNLVTVKKEAPNSTRKLEEQHKLLERFRLVVGSLVLLSEPLSIRALANLLDKPIPFVIKAIQRLGALLSIPDKKSPKSLRILHLSFRDFLTSRERCKADGFWVDPGFRNGELAKCCFKVMEGILKHDICNLKLPGYAVVDIKTAVLDTCIPTELRYACRYWMQHIRDSESTLMIPLLETAYLFLKEHLLHWVEVLGLLGEFFKVILILGDLRNILMNAQKTPAGFLSFVEDAIRFLRSCSDGARIAPLQLYSSALLFSPLNSKTRHIFHPKYTAWASANGFIPNDWDRCLQVFEHDKEDGWIKAISFSKTGKWLATLSSLNVVSVWDTFTGELTSNWLMFTHDYTCEDIWSSLPEDIIFSSIEENHVITVSSLMSKFRVEDGCKKDHHIVVGLWNAETGDLLCSIPILKSEVYKTSFDSERLIFRLSSNKLSVQMTSTDLNGLRLAIYLSQWGAVSSSQQSGPTFCILLLNILGQGCCQWMSLKGVAHIRAEPCQWDKPEDLGPTIYDSEFDQHVRFHPNQEPKWVISISRIVIATCCKDPKSAVSNYDYNLASSASEVDVCKVMPLAVCIWCSQTGKDIYSGRIALDLYTADKTRFNPEYFDIPWSGHNYPAHAHLLAVSYSDPLLVAFSFSGAIAIWEMDDKAFTLDHRFTIFDPFFRSDGRSWGGVKFLEFSPYQKNWLLAGYKNRLLSELNIWDFRTGSCLYALKEPSSLPNSIFPSGSYAEDSYYDGRIEFSPHVSGQIASGQIASKRGTFAYLWGLQSDSESMEAALKEDPSPTGSIQRVDSPPCLTALPMALEEPGRLLRSPQKNGRSYQLDSKASQLVWICSPDLKMLLFADRHQSFNWRGFSGWGFVDATGRYSQKPSICNDSEAITSGAFSNDGRYLVSVARPVGHDYSELKIWDLELSEYCSLEGTTTVCTEVLGAKQETDPKLAQFEPVEYGSKFIFSPDSRFVLLLCRRPVGLVIDWEVRRASNFMDPVPAPEYYVPRGVWETRTGRFLKFNYAGILLDFRHDNSETFTTRICFSPDSSQVAFNIESRETKKCSVLIWELPKRLGEPSSNSNPAPSILQPESIAVLSFNFSSKIVTLSYTLPDSMGQFQLTVVSSDGEANIWDPRTGLCIRALFIPTELRAILPLEEIIDSDWTVTHKDSRFISGGALEPLDWGHIPGELILGKVLDKFKHNILSLGSNSPLSRADYSIARSVYFLVGTRLPDLAIAMYHTNDGLSHEHVILLVIWELDSGMRHEFSILSTYERGTFGHLVMMLPARSPDASPFTDNGELLTTTGPVRLQTYTRQQLYASATSIRSDEPSLSAANGSTPLPGQNLNSTPLTSVSTFELVRCGLGLSDDCSWVTWNGYNILWIPYDYRYDCNSGMSNILDIERAWLPVRAAFDSSSKLEKFESRHLRYHPGKIEHEHICSPRFSKDTLLIPARNGYICRYTFDIAYLTSLLADFPPIRVSEEPTISKY